MELLKYKTILYFIFLINSMNQTNSKSVYSNKLISNKAISPYDISPSLYSDHFSKIHSNFLK